VLYLEEFPPFILSGTGAAATAVAAVARGLVDGSLPIAIMQVGGSLSVEINDDCLIQRGRACIVFEGVIDFDNDR